MPLKIHPGVIPLGKSCHVFADAIAAVFPAQSDQEVELTLPGHEDSPHKSVIILKSGRSMTVGLKPDTVVERYTRAVQKPIAEQDEAAE
jgi:hypothetical protein